MYGSVDGMVKNHSKKKGSYIKDNVFKKKLSHMYCNSVPEERGGFEKQERSPKTAVRFCIHMLHHEKENNKISAVRSMKWCIMRKI